MTKHRMKYADERRAWVKSAREFVPVYRKEAIYQQGRAADMFAMWSELPLAEQSRLPSVRAVIAGIYEDARRAFNSMRLYQTKALANLEEGEEFDA